MAADNKDLTSSASFNHKLRCQIAESNSRHGLGQEAGIPVRPTKRAYKQYLREVLNPKVPRTTEWRWRNENEADVEGVPLEAGSHGSDSLTDEATEDMADGCNTAIDSSCHEYSERFMSDVEVSHYEEFEGGPADEILNFALNTLGAEGERPLNWDDEDGALSDILEVEGSDDENNLQPEFFDVIDQANINANNHGYPVVNENIPENNENDVIEEPNLHDGTTLTLSQFQILLLSYIFKHKISGQALEDLCRLIELLLPGVVPKSSFLFKKALPAFGGKCKSNIFCGGCLAYLGCAGEIDNVGHCQVCNLQYNVRDSIKQGNFFLTIPMEDQIRKVMESIDEGTLIKKSDAVEDVYTDVLSGRIIQDMHNAGELTDDDITVLWNFDGVPIYKSTNFSITPIQFSINELPYSTRKKNILMYGLWFGQSKPKAATFLKPFVEEARSLADVGMVWCTRNSREEIHSRIYFLTATCDSVARPVIRNTVQFNGAYGCDWCLHEGQRVERGNGFTRCYPLQEIQPALRTADMQEDLGMDVEEGGEVIQGVKGVTYLSLLPKFDIVEGFVVDYMHCVLLGVTRQFTTLWFDSQYHEEPWYIATFTNNVDEMLQAIHPPSELTRAPRSLSVRKYWKASEWRIFLLYYSPLVLKGILPDRYYEHWMLLVTCMHSLLKETVTEEFLLIADNVLSKFVSLVTTHYGLQHVSFNVHQLTHLVESVRRWGPLWATSAFPFEGNNQVLLGLFHGKTDAPVQIAEKFSLKVGIKSAGPDVMAVGSVEAQRLYIKLSHSGRYLPVREEQVGGVYLYGRPVKKPLEVTTRAAIERFLRQDLPVQEYRHYMRFSTGQFICHGSSYERSKKRQDDMVILHDDTICLVKELVIITGYCQCDVGQCDCDPYPFVVLKRQVVNNSVFFQNRRLQLKTSHIHEITRAAETVAVPVDDLRQKCVAVKKGNRLFALPIPNHFETD